MPAVQKISPFLWFDDQAEAAVAFYVGIFRDAKVVHTSRYGEAGKEVHGRPPGTAMTIAFELEGQPFTALNGGPVFQFSGAISFVVRCDTQAEVDHYWDALTAGGDERAQRCGWLKDKFGVSWQVVPGLLPKLLGGADQAGSQRAMAAMMRMRKLDIAEPERAYAG